MKTRPYSALLLAAGLTLGSVSDRGAPEPDRHATPVVLTADFHVHAFPGDGMLPVWELRREAARRGVDVIAITNHNHSIAARLPTGGSERLPLVIPGQEITTPGFHLVAVGVREMVDWRLPLREAIAAVHAQGGVAIAAHPVPDSWRVRDEDALRALDGTEAVHALGETYSRGRYQLREFYRLVRGLNPRAAAIGSSDFHGNAPIGRCRTHVIVDEVSEAGVLDAIRRGRTVASDNRGTFVGDADLVALVKERRGEAPPARSDLWRPVSVATVLAALALLVLLD